MYPQAKLLLLFNLEGQAAMIQGGICSPPTTPPGKGGRAGGLATLYLALAGVCVTVYAEKTSIGEGTARDLASLTA